MYLVQLKVRLKSVSVFEHSKIEIRLIFCSVGVEAWFLIFKRPSFQKRLKMCGPEELKSTKTIDLLVWRLQLQLSVNTNVNVTSHG